MSLVKYTKIIVCCTILLQFFTHNNLLAQQVTGFTLMNASNNEELGSIQDGEVINLAFLPSRELNIRANTNPATVASLVFDFNGVSRYRVESVAPYALAGDVGGVFKPWALPLGENQLKASVYSARSGTGEVLSSLSITFTVIDDPNANPEPTPTPEPPAPTPTPNPNPNPSPTCSLPSGWSAQDVGPVVIPGEACFNNGTYTIKASGKDIWNRSDEFYFVAQSLNCESRTEIIAKVESIANTNIWAKAGVMIRASKDADAAHAMMIVTPSMGVSFQHRNLKGERMTEIARTSGAAPKYVRLVRDGNTFTGYVSNTNGGWTPVGQTNIAMGSNIQIGLAVTSHNAPVATEAVISEVSIDCEANDPPPTPIPTGLVLKMINTQTNATLSNDLTAGVTIDINQVSDFNVIAEGVPDGTKSVLFRILEGPFAGEVMAQNKAPYMMFGKNKSRTAQSGTSHRVRVSAYSGVGISGVLLDQKELRFSFSGNNPEPDPDPQPDPQPDPNPSPVPSDEIWLEAECAAFIGSAWTVENDPTASGGKVLVAPESTESGQFLNNPPKNSAYHIVFDVDIPEKGNYHVYLRHRAAFDADHGSNSVYRDFNEPDPSGWGKQIDLTKKGALRWVELKKDQPFYLEKGVNKLYFGLREDGLRIDKIFLKKDVDVTLGKEEVGTLGTNCGEVEDPLEEPLPGPPSAVITGELKKWHNVTLSFNGPFASETDNDNPFMNYRMNVTFTKGSKTYVVPGYFAADGNAGETGANSGNIWRVHFAPDEEGVWNYFVSFRKGTNISVNDNPTAGVATSFDGASGALNIGATDKKGLDLRGKGRLQYVGEHYLRFAETDEYFIKVGADAPETLLAYEDFDNTYRQDNGTGLKNYNPHKGDWKQGDPTWKGGKGKGLIGAINYLAEKGNNVFSFLTYNAGGDGKNVWPFIAHTERLRYDCSKLDQWEIIFAHGEKMGMYLHFKTQERENDSRTWGLDAGDLGPERKLYYRELMARFGHHMALNWNLGEENRQTVEQRKQMAKYFYDHDPYHHHVVIHNYTNQENDVFGPLLGNKSKLTGISYQMAYDLVHENTLIWLEKSVQAGKKWVVANDEQNPATYGVPPDPGWPGHTLPSGAPTQRDIRHLTLWGNLMAGGAGVEYYFGYRLRQDDLDAQNWRSRDRMWDYNRYAKEFFENYLPFWEMKNHNELTSTNNDYCFAKLGHTYAIYLPYGGKTNLDVSGYDGSYSVMWFNPRTGETWQDDNLTPLAGKLNIGEPPYDETKDWTVLLVRDNHFFSVQNSANLTANRQTVAYPNPASTYVNFVVELSRPGDVSLNIYNMTEVIIAREFRNVSSGKQVVTVQVSDLPDGVYNFSLKYEGIEIKDAIIVQR